MKKLAVRSMFFAILFITLLLLIPIPKKLHYQCLNQDCFNHAQWLYNRIYENPKKIDLVFLGSSHTINSINDSLIQQRLQHTNLNYTNLGYCRLGPDLYITLLNQILQKHSPKTLVLEVREDDNRYSHPVFAYLASGKDILQQPILFNRDYISNIYAHLKYKIEIIQNVIFKTLPKLEVPVTNFGFSSHTEIANPTDLEKYKNENKQNYQEQSSLARNFYMQFARTSLRKIAQICKQNKIKLIFLYMPSYGPVVNKPQESDTYKALGKLIQAPQSIFENKQNWYDVNHLNTKGANELSEWLATQIQ
jgi:hypothetical protein